ncbi:DNA/RNA non-specific endonuclease [Variovorax ginsengisoli]|uniref:Endonuclease n=1 Tax=Variovorax ginsengisoli TaxID=363844 RepID=A0ABT8SA08_9BURK|nr:DNA/RNA non-specific endonuclease [Variovorax ginsengisoli]MDN8616455.1 DNA/RNA non-specific endonuclease [Variovorax ginsengisoli]MDO1535625.1 DNA/RNA non-specific endonuclease [Variovorax ginsengisoli]
MQLSYKHKSFLLAAKLAGAALLALASQVAGAWSLGAAAEHAVSGAVAKHSRAAFQDQAAAPVALPSGRGFSSCASLFPQKNPLNVASVSADWKPIALCSNQFAVLYSGLSKTPLVTFERLNREQIADAKDEQRTDQFFPDPRLPRGARAELEDYRGSGLDRGHLAPAGDQPDPESMAQSFALSNMVPQDQTNNRKIWSKVEGDVRKFVRRAKGDVYVFSGPIFNAPRRTIGPNRVWVPSHLFKLVYDEASGRSWAYILPNTADARIEAPMDYESFVKATGWNLLSAVHQ